MFGRRDTRKLFNTYLVRMESYGGNAANGDGWTSIEHEVIETGEFHNMWWELKNETKKYGLPVKVIGSYSDRRSAYRALTELEA